MAVRNKNAKSGSVPWSDSRLLQGNIAKVKVLDVFEEEADDARLGENADEF